MTKRKRNDVLWTEAKRLRNDCTKRLRNARADYIKENLENNQGNSKKFGKNIQNILHNRKNKSSVTFDLYDSESNLSISSNDTADFINEFLVDISPKLASKIDTWRIVLI